LSSQDRCHSRYDRGRNRHGSWRERSSQEIGKFPAAQDRHNPRHAVVGRNGRCDCRGELWSRSIVANILIDETITTSLPLT
jgi:hypothetical protein